MKLGKKPQRFIDENLCSILEYILSDHFMIRSIKTKIHSQPNTVLASFHNKSVSTNLALMNKLLHSQTSIRMNVQELSHNFIISNLLKIRIPYIQKSGNARRHIVFVKSTTSITKNLIRLVFFFLNETNVSNLFQVKVFHHFVSDF